MRLLGAKVCVCVSKRNSSRTTPYFNTLASTSANGSHCHPPYLSGPGKGRMRLGRWGPSCPHGYAGWPLPLPPQPHAGPQCGGAARQR
eukprot:scaffold11586_cov21-Tisochrysis_lutea.AAC.1